MFELTKMKILTFEVYKSWINLGLWSSLSMTFTVKVVEADNRWSGLVARSFKEKLKLKIRDFFFF